MAETWDIHGLSRQIRIHQPDVLLMGMKRLDNAIITEIEHIRETFPDIGCCPPADGI
jgi:hypothetical protein